MQQGSGRSMLADIAVRVRARLGDLGFCGCFVSKLVFWLAWGPGSWLVYHRSCAWVHAMGPGTDAGPLVHLGSVGHGSAVAVSPGLDGPELSALGGFGGTGVPMGVNEKAGCRAGGTFPSPPHR